MENPRQNLITEPQIKKIQAVISNLYDKNTAEEIRDRLKTHYLVPSFWQLTKQEASEIIEKLLKVEAEREASQPKLF